MTGSKLNENIKTHFIAIKSKVVVVKFTKVYKQNLAQIFGAADPKNNESFYSSHLSAKEQATALAMNSNPKLDLNWNEAFDKAFKELNNDKNKFKELNVTLEGDPLKHPYGEALNVMCFNGKNNELHINDTTISTLMKHSLIKDRKVVVVSITGLYRHGKSSFMDYCLRYMYAHVRSLINEFN